MSNFEDRYGDEADDPAFEYKNSKFGAYLYTPPMTFPTQNPRGYYIENLSHCLHISTQRCLFTAGSWHNVCLSCGMAKGASTLDEWKRL